MLIISASLSPNEVIMSPTKSFGTSISKSSYGSYFTPSTSLMMTFGLETSSSNPSRLIFSMRIPRCNSPLPETIQDSLLATLSTRKATSFCVSLNNLSSIFLAVNSFPSFPEKGDVLVPNVICNVGSSK